MVPPEFRAKHTREIFQLFLNTDGVELVDRPLRCAYFFFYRSKRQRGDAEWEKHVQLHAQPVVILKRTAGKQGVEIRCLQAGIYQSIGIVVLLEEVIGKEAIDWISQHRHGVSITRQQITLEDGEVATDNLAMRPLQKCVL